MTAQAEGLMRIVQGVMESTERIPQGAGYTEVGAKNRWNVAWARGDSFAVDSAERESYLPSVPQNSTERVRRQVQLGTYHYSVGLETRAQPSSICLWMVVACIHSKPSAVVGLIFAKRSLRSTVQLECHVCCWAAYRNIRRRIALVLYVGNSTRVR